MSEHKTDPSLLPGAVSSDEKQFVLDHMLGFFDIKVLDFAIAQQVFERIGDESATVVQVAERCNLPERSTEVLLIALNSLGLIRNKEGSYSLSSTAKKFFVEQSPYFQGPYIRSISSAADSLPRLAEGLKENKPIREVSGHFLEETDMGIASNLWVSHSLLKHMDLGNAKHMLILGGGAVRFAAAAVSHYPNLKSTIMDLQPVCEVGAKRIAEWGLSDKINIVSGKIIEADWPTGHDVIAFIRSINKRPREVIEGVLRRAHDRLPKGGRVIVAAAGLMVDRQHDQVGALAARLLILHTISGRSDFTYMDEWPGMLDRAGFETEKMVVDDPYGMVIGTRKD